MIWRMGTDSGTVDWLDADEAGAWNALLGVVLRLRPALDRQLQRDSGLNSFDYGILASLVASPDGTLRMSELAELVDGTLPRLSQAVGRLEKRGWVRRTPDPTDGRYTLGVVTDEGVAKLHEAAPCHVAEVRRVVFDPLTRAQVRQLESISRRITGAIDPQ